MKINPLRVFLEKIPEAKHLSKFLHLPWMWGVFFGCGAFLLLAERLLTLALLPEKLFWLYAIGAWFGDLAWVAVLLAAALAFRSRILAGAGAALLAFELLFHLFNLLLLHTTVSVVNFSMCRTLFYNTNGVSMGIYLGRFYWLYLLLAILLLGVLIVGATESFSVLFDREKYHFSRRRILYGVLAGFAFCGFSFLTFYNYAKEGILYKGAFPREWGARPVQQYLWDIAYDIARQRSSRGPRGVAGFFPDSPDAATVGYWRRLGLTGAPAVPFKRLAPYRKILVIAVESLDYDFVENPSMPADLTPFLHRLTAGKVPGVHSFLMRNYFTAAQPTAEALNSLLASRLDYARDTELKNASLYSVLGEHGFAGYYFCGSSGSFHNQANEIKNCFGPNHAVFLEDIYRERDIKGDGYWGLDDVSLFNAAFDMLCAEKSEKVFAVISTIDTHPPYRVSTHLERDFGSDFLNSIAACDRNLERFLARVIGSDWFDEDTLIIVTADHSATHGENFTGRKEFTPDRIPLWFIGKDARLLPLLSLSRMCGAIDFAPTILHIQGIAAPETFQGRSFLNPLGRAVSIYDIDTIFLHRDASETLRMKLSAPRDAQERAILAWYQRYYGGKR